MLCEEQHRSNEPLWNRNDFCSHAVTMRTCLALLAIAAAIASCSRSERPGHSSSKPAPSSAPATPKPSESAAPTPNRLPPIDRDFNAIRERGEIAVAFTFNSTGYFIYRGETLGYEYELLRLFARENKLRLKPVVVRDSRTLYEMLDRGEADVVAAQIVAGRDQSQAAFTASLYETAPVVVQRGAAESTRGMTPTVKKSVRREEAETGETITIRARQISTPAELAGTQVHLPKTSAYRPRLLELNEELSDDIVVVEVEDTIDRLIGRLAEGEIGYTVAAENVARLRTGEYSNLIIRPTLGPPQPVVWGVRSNAAQLLSQLNQWIDGKRKSGLLNILYRKYFLDRNAFRRRVASRYLTAETGRLSPYDDLFRRYAKIPGWDWRLLASQAYQESHFNPNARSWAGARGIMQIMPATARELRVNPANPEQSIEGGCRYLWKFDQHWKDSITPERERIKFMLAAYNVGLGHVEDARRLAEKHGDNRNRWEDVAYWLIRKSKRAVYNDPVVKYGFARGTEPVTYVDVILDRYEHYKAFVVEEPSEAPVETPPAR